MYNDLKKLNLGSGEDKKEGYVNMDWNELTKPDIKHDLSEPPYPFTDGYFDMIEANHILEHLDNPFVIMKELHRLLKPGGRLIVRVPHFSRGMTHAEHKHGFDVTFPLYFEKKTAESGFSGYFGVNYKLVKLELHWMKFFKALEGMGYGKLTMSILRFLNIIISSLANLSPNFCSRIWCFWVGGFEEVEFIFTK
ncbi:MAG: class I SAM-dependent methyltransferase [Candidatus Falkowbacteria bacterium]